ARRCAARADRGPGALGRAVCGGEVPVLAIATSVGDEAQLGHSSALLRGQSVPAGERWHGSPAQRTEVNYVRVPPAPCGTLRRARYAGLALLGILFVHMPLLLAGLGLLFDAVSSLVRGLFVEALVFSVVLFFGAALVGLLAVGIV